jgi:hypothetical protein
LNQMFAGSNLSPENFRSILLQFSSSAHLSFFG